MSVFHNNKEGFENKRQREKEWFAFPCMIIGSNKLSSSSDGHFEVETKAWQGNSLLQIFQKETYGKI